MLLVLISCISEFMLLCCYFRVRCRLAWLFYRPRPTSDIYIYNHSDGWRDDRLGQLTCTDLTSPVKPNVEHAEPVCNASDIPWCRILRGWYESREAAQIPPHVCMAGPVGTSCTEQYCAPFPDVHRTCPVPAIAPVLYSQLAKWPIQVWLES